MQNDRTYSNDTTLTDNIDRPLPPKRKSEKAQSYK